MFQLANSRIEEIAISNSKDIKLLIKREDLIHPVISGNKYRKLKYNILKAKEFQHKTLLTFGGAFSNHIAAVAEAGRVFGFKTIGIIRGDELESQLKINSTLSFAKVCGMTLKFVSRYSYRNKSTKEFQDTLKDEFGDFFLLPEGGTNELAVKGCGEILDGIEDYFDIICCPVGTGGTLAGLINCSKPRQQVLGFSALKGDFLQSDIAKFAKKDNWNLISDYHFGGYAKINSELVSFINRFKSDYNIQLDPIYTAKMMYGIMDLIKQGVFDEHSKILAIHTGGLQGITGINENLDKRGLALIDI